MSAARRALVTGASGFIGRHLVPALAERYAVVDTVDLLPSPITVPGTELTGDACDLLPRLDRYDAVFHLAASVGGRQQLEDDPMSVVGNLAIDSAFFRFVARTRPDSAAYLSSSAVYPFTGEPVPGGLAESVVDLGESQVGVPDGVYGWVKLTGERIANAVTAQCGIPIALYRPFTIYGPGQTSDYPVPAIVARARARLDPIVVWGSGQQVRDLIHIDDAVAAIVESHDHISGATPVNVCTGVGTTFAQIAAVAADAAGYTPTICGDTSKPGGVASRVGAGRRMAQWHVPMCAAADGIAALLHEGLRREADGDGTAPTSDLRS